jgi:hypothetical protein
VIRDQPLFGFIPRVKFSDKGSYVESATKDYDQVSHLKLFFVTSLARNTVIKVHKNAK